MTRDLLIALRDPHLVDGGSSGADGFFSRDNVPASKLRRPLLRATPKMFVLSNTAHTRPISVEINRLLVAFSSDGILGRVRGSDRPILIDNGGF